MFLLGRGLGKGYCEQRQIAFRLRYILWTEEYISIVCGLRNSVLAFPYCPTNVIQLKPGKTFRGMKIQ